MSYPKAYLYRRLVQAKLYIDKYYYETIDLNNIAGEAYCSKFHFIRLFKNVYGTTPHQYLISVRVNKAKELLREGRSVADVCFNIGFESISSFTSLFKKQVGMTPAAWQSMNEKLTTQQAEQPLAFIPGCFANACGRL